jgi:predicted nucleic acid-binding protein
MIVVDTNIISYLLIPNDRYNQLADELFEKDSNWISPILWRHELLSVLSIYLRRNIINSTACKSIYQEAVETVTSRPISDFEKVFNIIENSNLSSYDCEFVALANENKLPLITEDKKITREFPDIACTIKAYLNR